MRSRVLGVAVLAVTLAITLFGVPLAAAVHRLFYSEERGELEKLALRAAVSVPEDAIAQGRPLQLPATDRHVHLAVYDVDRRRIAGEGPDAGDSTVADALTGGVSDATTRSDLVVAVPIVSGERVVAVARAASSLSVVRTRIALTWALMAGLAALATTCASALAAVQSRRLTRPLQELEAVAQDLGAGNFATRASPSGVGEIDRAGTALNQTADRLDALLARERAFSANASHQLRTPLTGLRLGLESALADPDADLESAARQAITTTEELSRTVDDVLALARGTGSTGERLDVAALLDDVRRRWQGTLAAHDRELVIVDDDPPAASASAPAVRQILDVLLDNAYKHGSGRVTVTARGSGGALAIDVEDEGSTAGRPLLPPPASDNGRLGLGLALSLAEAEQGRLVHARTEAHTRLTVLLPQASEPDRDGAV